MRNIFLLMARIPPQVMLVAVLALAIGATVMVNSTLQERDRVLAGLKAPKPVASSDILVANRDIPEGGAITQDAVETRSIESSKVPAGALYNANMALGMHAKVAIRQGDTIMSQFLSYAEKPAGFEAKIKPGFRAITFPVDSSTGVAGFLTPDSHVDILAQIGSGAEAKALPILSDVQVIAVGQTFKKEPGSDAQQGAQQVSCVTVSVGPVDAGKLINAMTAGKLYCLMRNSRDLSPLAVRDVSTAFPKDKSSDSIPQSDLTQLPPPVIPMATPQLPPPAFNNDADAKARARNIDMWAGSKKDQLEVPPQ